MWTGLSNYPLDFERVSEFAFRSVKWGASTCLSVETMQLHPARIQFQYVIAPYRRAIGLRMSLRAQMCGEGKRFEVSGLTSTSNPIPCVIFLSNILQGPWQHLEGSRYTSELLLTCHWLTGILGLPWWATLDVPISKLVLGLCGHCTSLKIFLASVVSSYVGIDRKNPWDSEWRALHFISSSILMLVFRLCILENHCVG